MCGCTSSKGNMDSYSANQPGNDSSTKGTKVPPVKMSKRIPIAKQLASIKEIIWKYQKSIREQSTTVTFVQAALSKGTDLEKAVATAALVYDNAADTDGKLSKSEAKNLLQTQFMHFMQGQETKPKYQEIISALDENKNDQIDFEDFMVQLLSLTLMSDLWKEIQNVKKTK